MITRDAPMALIADESLSIEGGRAIGDIPAIG
jgi:hypothetical protein